MLSETPLFIYQGLSDSIVPPLTNLLYTQLIGAYAGTDKLFYTQEKGLNHSMSLMELAKVKEFIDGNAGGQSAAVD